MSFKQGHGLVIGTGTHQYHPTLDVPIAVADAAAVAQALRDTSACGYPPEQVHAVRESQATKAGILAALDDLAARAGAGDTVFLFYCGHGALGTDGNYYLVSHDAQVQGGRVLAGTGVREAELLQKLRAVKARRMLMIFNACHSGNISPALGLEQATLAAGNPDEDAAAALLGTGEGRIILAACRAGQVSYVGKGALSIFTQALVDGLQGKGVRNSNGFISAFSLYEHVYESVAEVVQKQVGAVQEPELTVLHGVGPFAVALYRGASALGAFADDEPLPAGMAVREVRPETSARRFAQHVNTGGGAFIGGSVHTGGGDFVGRDKIVHGPVATGGSAVSTGGGTAVSGQRNVVITGKVGGHVLVDSQMPAGQSSVEDLRVLLDELRRQVAALQGQGLSAQDGADATKNLDEAAELTTRHEPPAKRIVRALENVKDVLQAATGTVGSAAALAPLVDRAIQLAQSLFAH